MDLVKLGTVAMDLTKVFPRSPREKLSDYVIAARTLDKCRAVILGQAGEYKFNCPLDQQFFDFSEIDADQFKSYVGTGATDQEVSEWIQAHAVDRPRVEIIKWNNRLRGMRICELPDEAQEFLEEYTETYLPKGCPLYSWFDVYDLEEGRI